MKTRAALSLLLSALPALPAAAGPRAAKPARVPPLSGSAGSAVRGAWLAAAPSLAPAAPFLPALAFAPEPFLAPLPMPVAAPLASADEPELAAARGLAGPAAVARGALQAGDDDQARLAGAASFDGAVQSLAAAADGLSDPSTSAPEDRRSSGLSPPSDEEVAAAYAAARPGSIALEVLAPARFAAEAADILMQYTFGGRAFLEGLAARIPVLDLQARAFLGAVEDIAAAHDAGDAASRRFLDLVGRWYAFMEHRRIQARGLPALTRGGERPHMPPSPLPEGEYWDMAAGLNAGHSIRGRDVGRETPYALFDRSSFVASYLRAVAALAGKPNVSVREEDILKIARPAKPLAALRTKNAIAYVPGFERKLEEMAGWIAPGGRLIIQNDPNPYQRRYIVEKHGPLIERLIAEGWTLDFGFSGGAGRWGEYVYDTVVLTRPKDASAPGGAAAPGKAWRSYVEAGPPPAPRFPGF